MANRNDLEKIEDQVSLQTLYTLIEVVTLSKKIEYQHLKAGLKFSNHNSEPSSSIANKGR